ncbi:uncharacterized protein LOC106065737 isoform X2 [Biomphalaria glabrata]|uniref:Uncharacterized protein LOC106065737 isoform X2 n=1 Tax=Biomphalaria glabrata TaxID=6526 RepID=A0A9W3BPB3_BIOGL|nr:uncharacterized protein LOC106065737 isoform X2 [Biomphalaria glabrata]
MNKSHGIGYSPLRAKRRQSDAKWRASVATCYDVLKYVIPNVQNLSKRKISKALILQESEKHIKKLETALCHMLHVEGKSQGKEILMKDEESWSHCTLEKLQTDFTEKQRLIFHSSTHGRRCYNLLHDIKEDVFNMQADPSKLLVVSDVIRLSWEDSFNAGSEVTNIKNNTDTTEPNLDHSFEIKVENVEKEAEHSSIGVDYTYLLKALKCEGEQKVPDASTHLKPVRQKYSKLTFPTEEKVKQEVSEDSANQTDVNNSYKVVVSYTDNHVYDRKDGRRVSTLLPNLKEKSHKPNVFEKSNQADSNTYILNSPVEVALTEIKKEETITPSTPMTGCDPLLCSASSPTFQKLHPLVSTFDTDLLLKRPTKIGSARKKLNFNVNPQMVSNTQAFQPLSPDRQLFSSPSSGFTPVKLPDEFSSDGNNSFVSPWKALNSPFESRSELQSYASSTLSGLENSLLCFESIDSADLEDSHGKDSTPERQYVTVLPESEDRCKRKMSKQSTHCHKQQPKCRRKLERFYDQEDFERNSTDLDSTQVVPQLDAEIVSSFDFDWDMKTLSPSVLEHQKDVTDFDGFYLYYCQVNQQLNETTDNQEVPTSAVAAKVAHMWTKLSDQDKSTLTTLASLELQESEDSIRLSQDLEDVQVEPLDPQELIHTLDD